MKRHHYLFWCNSKGFSYFLKFDKNVVFLFCWKGFKGRQVLKDLLVNYPRIQSLCLPFLESLISCQGRAENLHPETNKTAESQDCRVVALTKNEIAILDVVVSKYFLQESHSPRDGSVKDLCDKKTQRRQEEEDTRTHRTQQGISSFEVYRRKRTCIEFKREPFGESVVRYLCSCFESWKTLQVQHRE